MIRTNSVLKCNMGKGFVHKYSSLPKRNRILRNLSRTFSSSSSPTTPFPGGPVSVYVHWPYCAKICPYCDFNRYLKKDIDHDAMERAYLREIESFRHITGPRDLITIFFGGGTPSLARPSTIGKLIASITDTFRPLADLEITMEANPTSVEAKKLEQFREAGVNRLSLGVQSLDAEDLIFLGRNHSVEDAQRAIETAQRLFPRVSFDLIYARHSRQTPQLWKNELKRALSLGVSHVSLYSLTYEPNTPFYQRLHSKGQEKLSRVSEDLSADLYAVNLEVTGEFGLQQYEVSNFAKPGEESRHNLHYWQLGDYVGIGPGAAGRITSLLSRNGDPLESSVRESFMGIKLPEKWMSSIEYRGTGWQSRETLSPTERTQEALLFGLRTRYGISRDLWRQHSPNQCDFEQSLNAEALNDFVSQSLLELDARALRPTQKGLGYLDYMLPRLLK